MLQEYVDEIPITKIVKLMKFRRQKKCITFIMSSLEINCVGLATSCEELEDVIIVAATIHIKIKRNETTKGPIIL